MRPAWLLCVLAACPAPHAPPRPPAIGGAIPIEAPRTGLHAGARRGDLELVDGAGTGLVVASSSSAAGHRPLAGSIVDFLARPRDDAASDPLEWWRIGWVSDDAVLHLPQSARAVIDGSCVRVDAEADGIALVTRACPLARGFSLRTEASLPEGATIADEIQIGPSGSLVDDDGGAWTGEHRTRWFAFSIDGVAVAVDANARASREVVHWPDETWPFPIVLRYEKVAERRVVVSSGDVLDALAAANADVSGENVDLGPRGGTYALVSKGGREIFRGKIEKPRALGIPRTLACDVVLRDADGLVLPGPRPAPAQPKPRGTVHLETSQPAHVLFKGFGSTPDPGLASSPGTVGAGFSVYLIGSRADVVLPAGEYDVTATSGPLATVDRFRLTIAEGARVTHRIAIEPVPHPEEFVSADFHLHAAPSRDAETSIADRAASLACEGIDLVVATDHNRITDYGPALRAIGAARPIAIAGDEITMSGTSWGAQYGHFNVFPLPVPNGAPEDAVPPYWDALPDRIAPTARAMGARVVQVNHPRLVHSGFFRSAKLDPATGKASPGFSDDFDAMEVLNGFELEQPDVLRASAGDLVAFARRGKRIAATGNSDSHTLLFQEPGYPRTWVRAGTGDASTMAQRVFDAVLRGDTVASSGPLLDVHVEGKPPGSIVRPAKGKVHVSVRAFAAAWVPIDGLEIWRDDDVVARSLADPPKDGLRLAWEGDVEVTRDAAILAWVSSEKPIGPTLPLPNARAVAVSTPVYVDFEGDGRVISATR